MKKNRLIGFFLLEVLIMAIVVVNLKDDIRIYALGISAILVIVEFIALRNLIRKND